MTLRVACVMVATVACSACWSQDAAIKVELRRYVDGREAARESIDLNAERSSDLALGVRDCLSKNDQDREDFSSYGPRLSSKQILFESIYIQRGL